MKKKAKKKSQKTKSQFRKRKDMEIKEHYFWINHKDWGFFRFMARASREGRL